MKRCRALCVVLFLVVSFTNGLASPGEVDPLALVDDTSADEAVEMRQLDGGSGLGQNGTSAPSSSDPSSMTTSEEDSKDNSTDTDTSEPDGEPTDLYDPTPTSDPIPSSDPTPSNDTVQFPPTPTSTVPTPEPQVTPTSDSPSVTSAEQDNLVPYSIAGGVIILVIALAVFALIFRRNRESMHKQEGDRTLAMSEMFLSSRSRQDSQSERSVEVEAPADTTRDSRHSHEVRGSSDIYQDSDLSSGPRFSFESDSYRYSHATNDSNNSVPVLFDDPPSSRASSMHHAAIYDTDSDFSDV